MTTASTYAIRDSATMFGRDLRRSLRFPAMTLSGILTPVVMMLLFVFVLGGMMSAASMAAATSTMSRRRSS